MRGINEVVPIQDTLCSGIGAIERLEGDLFRFWMYVSQISEETSDREKLLVAKIVMARASIPNALMQTVAAIADRDAPAMQLIGELLH